MPGAEREWREGTSKSILAPTPEKSIPLRVWCNNTKQVNKKMSISEPAKNANFSKVPLNNKKTDNMFGNNNGIRRNGANYSITAPATEYSISNEHNVMELRNLMYVCKRNTFGLCKFFKGSTKLLDGLCSLETLSICETVVHVYTHLSDALQIFLRNKHHTKLVRHIGGSKISEYVRYIYENEKTYIGKYPVQGSHCCERQYHIDQPVR